MTPCSPRYLPCAGFLFNFKLTVFLIFSLLLSWRLGKQKSIRCGRRSRSLWITRTGAAVQPALQPWARNHGSIIRDQREGHGFRSGALTKTVFTVWARKWEKSSTQHRGSWSSLYFFFFFENSFGLDCVPPAQLSVWMIYRATACDNAHTTNLSAEHIDTWVCHYLLITLLTNVSIQIVGSSPRSEMTSDKSKALQRSSSQLNSRHQSDSHAEPHWNWWTKTKENCPA